MKQLCLERRSHTWLPLLSKMGGLYLWLAGLNTQPWGFVMFLSTGLKRKFKDPEWAFPDRSSGFSGGKIVRAIARSAFVG